ncbi:MAG TPA: trypsin-like peptidase domain-containing protein [Trebonia sp.]|nr:trypsin-like peptidase domain-containing protein [Trebonia sp.]
MPEPPRPKRSRHLLGLAATAAVAVAIGAGATLALEPGGAAHGGAAATSTTTMTAQQIASKVDPGLVDVTSTLGYQDATAKGTGIVLSSDGYILTNNHVINGATAVTITDIGNGKTYKATVVGYDESHDIAVLKATGAAGLTTASFGDSSSVKAGDTVVALGNAGGTDGTPSVAPGTVTALNQSITASDESSGSSEQLSGLIESNAGIQPGDSGGPLVNSRGQVIGVDTAASSGYQFTGPSGNAGGSGGFGFGGSGSGSSGSGSSGSGSSSTGSTTQGYTIPANQALSIAKQIEAGTASSVVHIGATAFLGVGVSTSQSGYTQGVEIAGATSGTPAASAGLAEGDVITAVAGHAVGTSTSIQQVLEGYHPGSKVSLAWTDAEGQSHTATVTLATGPAA